MDRAKTSFEASASRAARVDGEMDGDGGFGSLIVQNTFAFQFRREAVQRGGLRPEKRF